MGDELDDRMRWFAKLGKERAASGWSTIEVQKLRNDPYYGLKCFLLYAYIGRSGSPRGFTVAGVKAVTVCQGEQRHLDSLSSIFGCFYSGKQNKLNNPIFDPLFSQIRMPEVVTFIERGDLATAYLALKANGAGVKVRRFFLRDVAMATNAERTSWTMEQHMYCQPIDVWVRAAMKCLGDPGQPVELPKCDLAASDRRKAARLIQLSQAAGVSPMHVNHGIWYFASHCVADENRLVHLLKHCDVIAMHLASEDPNADANDETFCWFPAAARAFLGACPSNTNSRL